LSRLKNKEIQRIRMMVYFIEATAEIIEKEGIENVTIRKVADIAGYNSATIYNYFEELSHLIFFSSMRFLKKYTVALPAYIAKANDPLERFLLMWECFCKYSFKEPHIYHAVFSSNLGALPEELIKDYYGIFPTDLVEVPEDLKQMLLESNLSKRGRLALERCIEEGYLERNSAESVNEMQFLIWQGMLTTILNQRCTYTIDEAVDITMGYIRNAINCYRNEKD
jgi:AcrR family transcriptional regulator